jgi:hypothetical protein
MVPIIGRNHRGRREKGEREMDCRTTDCGTGKPEGEEVDREKR